MAKNKRSKDKIVIKSIGNSSTEVTGSCWLIEYTNNGIRKSILIENGLHQGKTVLNSYNENLKVLQKIPYEKIDYIFLAHAHIDHTGAIPFAIKRGFEGRIITTEKNYELCKPLLKDSVFIHMKDVKYLKDRKKKNLELLGDMNTYSIAMSKFKTYEVGIIHEINENLSFRYTNNSHCVGATSLELFIKKPNGNIKKIYYSSDLGSCKNYNIQPFLKQDSFVTKCNIAIIESTYGSSKRGYSKQDVKDERKDLIKTIKEVVSNNNRVLIPTFAFSRTQSMMCFMYENFKDDENFKDTRVVVDGKLSQDINATYLKILDDEDKEYFKEVMSWKNFVYPKEFKDSQSLMNQKGKPMVVLASSGMLHNGRSILWAKSLLKNPNDYICFIGYCAINTLGNILQNQKNKTVLIDGDRIPIKCNIKKYNSFSSHAQQEDLINIIKTLNCDLILLHHGSQESKEELILKGKEELHKINKTTSMLAVNRKQNTFEI